MTEYGGYAVPIPAANVRERQNDREAALFLDLLHSAGNPVLVLDASLAMRHANPVAEELFRPLGGTASAHSLAGFCGESCSFLCELVSRSIREDIPLKDREVSVGNEVWSLSLHRGEAAWILSLRPVTRELSLEYRAKRYRRQRDILLNAMEGIEGSVIIVDEGGRIRYMNSFTRKHVGDLMQGVAMADWPGAAGFYREDGVTLLEGPNRIFPRALKGATVIDEIIVVRNEVTGDAIRVRASATPVFDGRGRITHAIGWFHPIVQHQPQMRTVTEIEQRWEEKEKVARPRGVEPLFPE